MVSIDRKTVQHTSHNRRGVGRYHREELCVLDRTDSEGTMPVILHQFPSQLNDAYARSDGLAWEMGLIDNMISMKLHLIGR